MSKTIYQRGPIRTPAYKVEVVITDEGGKEYSYNALVNEQNGKIH